jgi:hypothetical protein
VISREVRGKLYREQRRVLALLCELRAAVDAGDTASLVARATTLEQSLDAHLELVAYVLESLSDDDPPNQDPPSGGG